MSSSVSVKNKVSFVLLFISLISFNALGGGDFTKDLKKLEDNFGGRIGVYVIDSETGESFGYKENERFPLCSSFKAFIAAAILSKSQSNSDLLNEKVDYKKRKLESYSPITGKHQEAGMTVGELAVAALQYSDNGATNILMEKYLGGLDGVNSFMRSIGDDVFRLDRWEPDLNTAIPGDKRDTSTPKSMATSLEKLTLGDILHPNERKEYQSWLKGNTTGDARIRAGVPKSWIVGDKTGTCGWYGTANDFAVIWRNGKSPIVISIYTTKNKKEEKHSENVIADAARIVVHHLNDELKN